MSKICKALHSISGNLWKRSRKGEREEGDKGKEMEKERERVRESMEKFWFSMWYPEWTLQHEASCCPAALCTPFTNHRYALKKLLPFRKLSHLFLNGKQNKTIIFSQENNMIFNVPLTKMNISTTTNNFKLLIFW